MLKIKEIFHSIQGEGPFAGSSAIFIRLAGCNLKCDFCDENYTKPFVEMGVYYILQTVSKLARKMTFPPSMIVITGGEPFLQDFSFLAHEIIQTTLFTLHVETNGTVCTSGLYPFSQMQIVCSPKKDKPILSFMRQHINWYKYVVRDGDVIDSLAVPLFQIYIQPMDEGDENKNRRNVEWAVHLCLTFNFILSLQVHKLAQIK